MPMHVCDLLLSYLYRPEQAKVYYYEAEVVRMLERLILQSTAYYPAL